MGGWGGTTAFPPRGEKDGLLKQIEDRIIPREIPKDLACVLPYLSRYAANVGAQNSKGPSKKAPRSKFPSNLAELKCDR